MKKKCLLFLIALVGILFLASCGNSESVNDDRHTKVAPAEMPDDFNFLIIFGMGIVSKNCIDTYNNTFTKDLVSAGTETIEFVIPDDKMRDIYAWFLEREIYDLPYDINEHAQSSMSDSYMLTVPANKYTLFYTCNKESGVIICDDKGPWDSKGAPDTRNRLVSFVDFICSYIYGTEKYNNMSPTEGAYA